MKLRREAAILKKKALASFRRAARSFNDLDDDGRTTSVLLHLQHAFEMLLKAGLVQKGVKVFDPADGKSYGIAKCVNLAAQTLKVTPEEAGLIRAVDAMRDEEQHWFAEADEALLYTHVRGAVTTFDDILDRVFGQKLASQLPTRKLLAPGSRRRPDARARIRTLLAMEAHVAEGVQVSKKDVDRVERAIKAGKTRNVVYPRLRGLGTNVEGSGITVTVRFTKKEGMPVTFVPLDDPNAAAVRQVDLQKTYYMSATDLAKKLGLTLPKAFALRQRLKIDSDPKCRHDFTFSKSTFPAFSDNAYNKMKGAIAELDMERVWSEYGPGKASKR